MSVVRSSHFGEPLFRAAGFGYLRELPHKYPVKHPRFLPYKASGYKGLSGLKFCFWTYVERAFGSPRIFDARSTKA
jgi:hypothetical protein